MESIKIYNELKNIKEVYKKDMYKALDKYNALMDQLYLEEVNKEVKGSRKKAITKIVNISKKLSKGNRPSLAYQKRVNHNNIDGYVFTDSYFLTFTRNNFVKVFDDITEEEKKMNYLQYPRVESLINIEDNYRCNVESIDFSKVAAASKLKKDDQKRDQSITFNGSSLNKYEDFKVWFNPDYLMIAYNLLEIEKNKEDIIIYKPNNNILSGVVFKNVNTEEFVLIMPIRHNKEVKSDD